MALHPSHFKVQDLRHGCCTTDVQQSIRNALEKVIIGLEAAKPRNIHNMRRCKMALRNYIGFHKLTGSYAGAARGLPMLALLFVGFTFTAGEAAAASSRFCEGGGWVLTQQANT